MRWMMNYPLESMLAIPRRSVWQCRDATGTPGQWPECVRMAVFPVLALLSAFESGHDAKLSSFSLHKRRDLDGVAGRKAGVIVINICRTLHGYPVGYDNRVR